MSGAFNFDHLRTTYFEECAELLDSAYTQINALSEGNTDQETVHALFRAIHSIKGGGGAFGCERLVRLAHAMETMLDLLREGRLALESASLSLLLRGTDGIADLLATERGEASVADGFEDDLIAALNHVAGTTVAKPPTSAEPQEPQAGAGWRVTMRPKAMMFRNANEPLLVVRELQRLGTVTIVADLSRLPALEQLEPEDAYLGWTIEIAGAIQRGQIEDVFEFISDDCELTIETLTHEPPPPVAPIESVARREPGARLETAAAQSVRVDVGKVDRLVNLVGELVINQAMLVQLGGTLPPDTCPGLIAGLETLSQHLRELQEGVMAIRTQPVKSVFSRMPRLVRDLSAQLGKDVRLVITGEGTEIDKTVVEQLADPLTHLLRNALDHGVEVPDVREAAGKPRQGTIHLGAEQRSGRIVIEVSDDGHGIDRPKVLARARERGIVAPDATPSDAEIDALLFLPSFSTATTVSNVSGRGVGMDVVRRNIQALGGRITLDSRPGCGSRFLLSLPLTLAVLDGLVVAVGRESYIVPLSAIVESLRPRPQDIHAVLGHGDVLSIRGAYIPLLPLHRQFAVSGAETDPSRGIVVIVETDNSGRLGLVVDDLIGQQQVVVKSLEANYGAIEGVGGATILGDGRVALILDIAGLRARAADTPPPPAALPPAVPPPAAPTYALQ